MHYEKSDEFQARIQESRFLHSFNNVTFNVIQNPPNYAVIRITPVEFGAPRRFRRADRCVQEGPSIQLALKIAF